MYLKMLNNFCVKEISNAHLTATLFHSLLELGNKEWRIADIIWEIFNYNIKYHSNI